LSLGLRPFLRTFNSDQLAAPTGEVKS